MNEETILSRLFTEYDEIVLNLSVDYFENKGLIEQSNELKHQGLSLTPQLLLDRGINGQLLKRLYQISRNDVGDFEELVKSFILTKEKEFTLQKIKAETDIGNIEEHIVELNQHQFEVRTKAKMVKQLEDSVDREPEYIEFGIEQLDKKFGGYDRGFYHMVVAGTGTGKTKFMMRSLDWWNNHTTYKIAYFGNEQTDINTISQLICMNNKITMSDFRNRKLSIKQKEDFKRQAKKFIEHEKHLYIGTVDEANNIDKIVRKCMVWKPDIVIVDVIAKTLKHDELTDIKDAIKKIDVMSKKVNCATILVTHPNDKARNKQEPRYWEAKDIRNASDYQMYASTVMFLDFQIEENKFVNTIDYRVLYFEKFRNAKPDQMVKLSFLPESNGYEFDSFISR